MSMSEAIAWTITIILLCSSIYIAISKRIKQRRNWNTDRRSSERREEQRRERERRRMARPIQEESTASERRRDDRRADERRNPSEWEDAYKNLIKKVDEEGFPSED